MVTRNINNFNLLRLVAAYSVLYYHSFFLYLNAGKCVTFGDVSLGALAVYVFFSISGFLIFKSWIADPNVFRYLCRRLLRILPALFIVVVLSLVVLGPLVGTLSVVDYYKDAETWTYLKNVLLYPVYHLPGVFASNHYPSAVNGSLWSLPVEFFMYLILILIGVVFRQKLKWGLVFALCIFVFAYFFSVDTSGVFIFYGVDLKQIAPNGIFFIIGAIIAAFKLEKSLTLPGSFFILALLMFTSHGVLFQVLTWIAIPYLSLAFALQSSWLSVKIKDMGDYSYGVYIYAFPVQQTTVYFFPGLPFFSHVIIDILITTFLAVVSWHFIEKNALKYKPLSNHPL
ncbi:acyltransferase family protein [Hydromonas duriensis]|uniref:Peptidoglycan/LPS O-acetylase OafA/YrhL n=1 Tax=Hydromonas duriensis TaxID=1527608 RepID=A0A4V3DJX4_9BURK|nr:acyltransferase [Hydromonas duriensis]TDR31571.1 peptidoglycan/LPS O-acetylase OafA/YrhL [Hydromonas duriensis]